MHTLQGECLAADGLKNKSLPPLARRGKVCVRIPTSVVIRTSVARNKHETLLLFGPTSEDKIMTA